MALAEWHGICNAFVRFEEASRKQTYRASQPWKTVGQAIVGSAQHTSTTWSRSVSSTFLQIFRVIPETA